VLPVDWPVVGLVLGGGAAGGIESPGLVGAAAPPDASAGWWPRRAPSA